MSVHVVESVDVSDVQVVHKLAGLITLTYISRLQYFNVKFSKMVLIELHLH